jgi:hypothetical protein
MDPEVSVFRHERTVFEILSDQMVPYPPMARRNMAMKVVQGLESVGNRAFICRIRLLGFIFNCSKALVVQRAFEYLDINWVFNCFVSVGLQL